ncbi:ankyrin [Aspergillus sclerotioniger CBS 115572]|uniref:Ankyrin n=1 Tax=Aspergillus sclerotioniger CBS 115572 TaxID=1450535 RepID=A0A317VNV1_9EURO|nr:ankyrin [Aspergillus sclerotioniger CBS 115572]PWY76023.1 ankyrin [Aspergillus sclerotioniger CBS 115572]
MSLARLPRELVLIIAEFLDCQHAINALARTSRLFFAQLNHFLYRYHVAHHIPAPALTWAARHDKSDVLKKLLGAGADLYCRSLWGGRPSRDRGSKSGPSHRHPIFIATGEGHTGFIEALLDAGMSDRLTQSDYNAILIRAAARNHVNVVRMLLARGINPWSPGGAMREAARCGYTVIVRVLLLDAEQRKYRPPFFEYPEICEALVELLDNPEPGHEETVSMLLTAGVDGNFRGRDRHTSPLGIAAGRRQVQMCRLLLEAGANPNLANSDTQGPLARAVGQWLGSPSQGHKYPSQEVKNAMMEVVCLLFEYGADPARAGGGWALHRALHIRHYEMARFLIDKGTRLRIPGLKPCDQATLDRAVTKYDYETVMSRTPLGWSVASLGPRRYMSANRRPAMMAAPLDEVPLWRKGDNNTINERGGINYV